LSIFNEKNGKKVLPNSIYIKILVFICLVCVSVFLFCPVQSAVNKLMVSIRANFFEEIEKQIGIEIRYSSIRPALFGSFDIRNLKILKNENVLLSVSRAKFYFSLPQLVFRKKIAVHTIQIELPVLSVDYERDRELFELLLSMLKNNEEDNGEFFRQISEFLPEDADYKIRDFSLFFTGKGAVLNVRNMDVDLRRKEEKIIIGVKFDGEAEYTDLLNRTFNVKTAMEINGAYSPELREGAANVSFTTFSVLIREEKREANFLLPASNDGGARVSFNFQPSITNIFFNEYSISLASARDASFSFDVNYDIKTGGIKARVDLNHFVLNDYADFSDYWKKFVYLFDMAVTGSLFYSREKDGRMAYGVNIQGGSFFAGSETAALTDSFVIRAYGDEEGIVVDDFRLCASSGTANIGLFQGILKYQGYISFDPFLPFGSISVSRLKFGESEDINASLNITANAGEINISGDIVEAGTISFLNPDVYLYPRDGYIGVTASGGFNIYENDLHIFARLNFSNPDDLFFLLDANYIDMSWHIEGRILDKKTLIIHDPNGLYIYGFLSNAGSVSGYIECIDFPVPVKGNPVYVNMYATLRYDSINFWYLDVAHFEVKDLQILNGADYFRISGVADQDGAIFREILYNDAVGLLAGSAYFEWDSDFSYLQFLVNITDGHENGELYNVEGVLNKEHINVNVSVSDMRLERFIKDSGTALISAGAILTNDELVIRNLKFDHTGIKSTVPFLQLNRADGFVKTNANVQGYAGSEKWLEGNIDLNANFPRVDSWFEIGQALISLDGVLKVTDIQYGDMTQEKFVFIFSNDNGNISFSGGKKKMLKLNMDNEGNFLIRLLKPFPVQGSVAGVYKNGEIDAHSHNFFIDDPVMLLELTENIPGFNTDVHYMDENLVFRGSGAYDDSYLHAFGRVSKIVKFLEEVDMIAVGTIASDRNAERGGAFKKIQRAYYTKSLITKSETGGRSKKKLNFGNMVVSFVFKNKKPAPLFSANINLYFY